jgi:hypothetical protein
MAKIAGGLMTDARNRRLMTAEAQTDADSKRE